MNVNPTTVASVSRLHPVEDGSSGTLRHRSVEAKAATNTPYHENSTPPTAKHMMLCSATNAQASNELKKVVMSLVLEDQRRNPFFEECAKAEKQYSQLEKFIAVQGADPRKDMKLFLGCAYRIVVEGSGTHNMKKAKLLTFLGANPTNLKGRDQSVHEWLDSMIFSINNGHVDTAALMTDLIKRALNI